MRPFFCWAGVAAIWQPSRCRPERRRIRVKCARKKESGSFLKKRTKKLLSFCTLCRRSARQQAKVFCFFFSKKKSLSSVPSLPLKLRLRPRRVPRVTHRHIIRVRAQHAAGCALAMLGRSRLCSARWRACARSQGQTAGQRGDQAQTQHRKSSFLQKNGRRQITSGGHQGQADWFRSVACSSGTPRGPECHTHSDRYWCWCRSRKAAAC